MESVGGSDTEVLPVSIHLLGPSVVGAAAFMIVACIGTMLALVQILGRAATKGHAPLILETVPALCLWVANSLPRLFPGAFAAALGHSVFDYDPRLNGTWLVETWSRSLLWSAGILFLVGMPWAIGNLARRRAVASSIAAVVLFLVWSALAFLGFTGHFTGYL